MLGKARNLIDSTAERHATVVDDELVSYDPHDLNRLIDTITAHEVAGRLRELAEWHHARAAFSLRVTKECGKAHARWHRHEARVLERLATRELARIERGVAR